MEKNAFKPSNGLKRVLRDLPRRKQGLFAGDVLCLHGTVTQLVVNALNAPMRQLLQKT
jgi:hypothetical protein